MSNTDFWVKVMGKQVEKIEDESKQLTMYINELRERMEKLEKKLKPVKADSTPTPMTQKRKKAK